MSSLKEIVDSLEPGDEVRGVFKELTNRPSSRDDWCDDIEPTGNVYTSTGTVKEYHGAANTKGLSISSNGQCLRQTSGAPGHWLVSLEVLKKGTK